MVVFQAKNPYFRHTMEAMNVMRKDMTLCDIVLTCGQRTIHAHRCVLAAASPYFHSLFLGNFNEASMGNIDLSSVTKDTETVETIIDFIYAGEINVTEDNLGAVMKLAQFFLMEELNEFCLDFMSKFLNLRNCLGYFFHYQDCGYHELCYKTLPMIESRFHDFIIFEEASLDITPVELHFLLTHKVLQFCHASDLLEFVLKWLLKRPTEKHFAVALDVIDNVGHDKNVANRNQKETDLEVLYEKVAARPEVLGTDSGKEFLKNSRKIMSKMSYCSSAGPPKTYNLQQHSPQLSSKQEDHTEMALVVFAPRPCVVETVESNRAKPQGSRKLLCFKEPVFDVCVYLMSQQSWYHVQQMADRGVPGSLLVEMTNGVTMRDKFALVLLADEIVYFFDLPDMTGHYVSYSKVNHHIESNAIFEKVITIVDADQTSYLIMRISICDDEDLDEVCQAYFRCYRLRDDDEWELVFATQKYDTDDDDGDTVAMISAGSNEMLIFHRSYSVTCVYLADMSEEKPEPVPLLMTSKNNRTDLESFHLLEGNNQVYIVKDSPQKVSVVYEYKLKSRKLVPASATSTPAYLTVLEPFIDSYPCMNTYSVSDGTSLWRIEGSRQKTSRLTELQVSRNKGLMQVKHTPPPFPFVAAVFAGRLDENIISRLEPISRYLAP